MRAPRRRARQTRWLPTDTSSPQGGPRERASFAMLARGSQRVSSRMLSAIFRGSENDAGSQCASAQFVAPSHVDHQRDGQLHRRRHALANALSAPPSRSPSGTSKTSSSCTVSTIRAPGDRAVAARARPSRASGCPPRSPGWACCARCARPRSAARGWRECRFGKKRRRPRSVRTASPCRAASTVFSMKRATPA